MGAFILLYAIVIFLSIACLAGLIGLIALIHDYIVLNRNHDNTSGR